MYIHIRNQEICCCCCFGYFQQTASEAFVELCFEASKWIAWLYLSWDSIPQGCAWKWEASLKKSILGLGRVMNRDVARMLEQIQSCLRYGGARLLYALNTNTALLNISFFFFFFFFFFPFLILLEAVPSTVALYRFLKKNQISSILQLFCEEN